MDCKVCKHPKALQVMRKVFAGEMTYVEAAKELELPTSTVFHCFSNHWEMEATADSVIMRLKEAKTVDDYVEVLKVILEKLIGQLKHELDKPGSAINQSAITRVIQEVRRTMRDVLEFEGQLKSGPLIQLTVLETQFTKLTSVLFTELCPKCRAKLLEVLPELESEQSEQPEEITVNT